VRTGKKVAVIGAGPAGIASATRLVGMGHEVVIFERAAKPGGIIKSVIPAERAPQDIVSKEIDDVIASLGGLIQSRQVVLNEKYNLDTLFAEGFDAILLATGLSSSATGVKGPRPQKGVEGAMDFLARTKKGEKVSGTVLVLGGGNTALDAATSAVRSGAGDVSIIYRRSYAEMPAWPAEREAAVELGIHLVTLTAPVEYTMDAEGRMIGLKVIRTRLGKPDEKGRHTPEPIPGTEYILPADLVVEAFGQVMDESLKKVLSDIRLTRHGLISINKSSFATSRTGVFAAGDVVNGGATVVQAVAEGSDAADAIDAYLAGKTIV
jgi:glutamate synthase (NADPH/NADH) small chain